MPAAQYARLREVAGAIEALNVAIERHAVPAAQASIWQAWREQWTRYLTEWRAYSQDTDYLDRMAGSTATQIESYATQYGAWADAFVRQWGGRPLAPLLQSAMPPPPPLRWDWLKQVGIGIAIAVGAAGVLWFLKGKSDA
jgi:hypothetical protein